MVERFDVVMPTLNSVSRVGEDILKKILRQIHEHIPLNRLLAIDDGSTDGTLEILEKFGAIVLKGAGSLGKAREIGIKNVETEWFYFIDDDNLIPPKFHERMWQYADENTGMIYPNAVSPFDNYLVRYENIIGRLRRTLGFKSAWEFRGYTGATLIRKQALKGINIPNIARQEDKFIKNYCQQQGWKVKFVSDIIVLHFNRTIVDYKTQYLEGYGLAKVRAMSKERVLISWLLTYPKALLTLPYTQELAVLREIPKMYYFKWKGFIEALKLQDEKEN